MRHTPFLATYLYADAAKAARKVRALQAAGAHFVIVDQSTDEALTVEQLERAAAR